jgi:TetR/AcrR family transcriptional regulator, acrAB operon repressor
MYVSGRSGKRNIVLPGSLFLKDCQSVMARTTKEESLETRSRILDAAEDVFCARGVSRTSLADIAEAAKVTRGAIYWHFKNKSDLFDAMCARIRLPMEAMCEAMAEEGEYNPLGLLRAAWVFKLQEAVRDPHSRKVFEVLFHKCEFVEEIEPILRRQRDAYRNSMVCLEQILEKAIEKKQLPPDLDPKIAAVSLQASVSGLLNNWLFAPDCFDLAANAEILVDACIDQVRHAPSLRKTAVSP